MKDALMSQQWLCLLRISEPDKKIILLQEYDKDDEIKFIMDILMSKENIRNLVAFTQQKENEQK